MKKIFQLVFESKEPLAMVDFIKDYFSKKDNSDYVTVNVKEIGSKLRYTDDDDLLFGMRLYVRVSKNSSLEFLSGFNIMFAYWDKVRECDEDWYCISLNGTYPSCIESHLNKLQAFMARAKGLGYEGLLEVKVDPFLPSFSKDKTLTIDGIYSLMIDKHLSLLEWTDINNYK